MGFLCTCLAIAYFTLTARFLLPKIPREEVGKVEEGKARMFFCSFKLAPKSPLVGVTLATSGLMATRDLRLVAIQNKDSFIGADKDRCLMEGDVYVKSPMWAGGFSCCVAVLLSCDVYNRSMRPSVPSLIFRGLPEGIAQMRREKTTELVMFGPRITLQRYRRRLMEVRAHTRAFGAQGSPC